jgi:hypothetical protein
MAEIWVTARCAFILRSFIFITDVWVLSNGMYAGRLLGLPVVGNRIRCDFASEVVIPFQVEDGKDR